MTRMVEKAFFGLAQIDITQRPQWTNKASLDHEIQIPHT